MAAAAFRVVLGLALVLAAPTSRAPAVVRVLGIFIAVAGFLTPLVGVDRSRRSLAWWAAQGPAVMRLCAACAVAGGLLLAYAVVP